MGFQSLKMKYSNIDMCFLARLFHQAQTSFFRRAFSMHFRFIYLPTLDTQQHYAVSALPTILYCGAVVGGMEFLPASQCQGHPQQLYVHRFYPQPLDTFIFLVLGKRYPLFVIFLSKMSNNNNNAYPFTWSQCSDEEHEGRIVFLLCYSILFFKFLKHCYYRI